MSRTTDSADSALRSVTCTFAPSFANSIALERPMPDPAPVTTTTLSVNSPAPTLSRLRRVAVVQHQRVAVGIGEVCRAGEPERLAVEAHGCFEVVGREADEVGAGDGCHRSSL